MTFRPRTWHGVLPPQDNPKFYSMSSIIRPCPSLFRRAGAPFPPMALTLPEVQRIAHLARIEISATEAGQTLAQLNDILGMIERLSKVDTTEIEPMSHPLGGAQRLRDDRVTESDARVENMRNAPQAENGLFLVPRVLE